MGTIEHRVGFIFAGIQNSLGGTIGTLPEKSTTDGYGFADSREDLGPRPLKSLLPHGGRQLSWY